MSFKLKTFLVLFMVSIFPYTLTIMLFSHSYKEEQRNTIIKEMQTQLLITTNRIEAHLRSLKSDIRFMASSDIMNDLLSDDLDKRISNMFIDKKNDLAFLGDFFATNNKKIVIASSNRKSIGKKYRQSYLFSVPIISQWNKNIGTLYVSYHLSNLKKFFTNLEYRHYYIRNDNYKELFKVKSFKETFSVNLDLPFYKGYQIFLEESSDNAFRAIKKYEQWFFLSLIFGTFFISIISYFFASRLITPIIALSKTASKITRTKDYEQQVTIAHRKDEIGDLTLAFNSMIDSMNSEIQHNQALTQEIIDTQREVIYTMGAIGENRSSETGYHVKRVAEYSYILALYYGLSQSQAKMLKLVSPMHDIGKVAIPDAILLKPGKLNDQEYIVMKEHATLGYTMLNHSKRELLKLAAITAHEHHEKWDGTGYPQGLKEENIHIFGRITALADIFDALSSKRIYKDAWKDEAIFAYLKAESGHTFDPKLVTTFFEHLDEILAVRAKYQDTILPLN